ncbi:MAG TPA: AsmA family protein, partial [Candidatus Udaeobacter sp.]|nr:AsmA family protein [Candidatus Udaeobacter sp.]
MRKWIITGTVLLLLCVGVIIAILNVNSYITHNKDYLINRTEQALGRKVSVEDIKVSLWGGIGFRLTNFAMAEDPAFASGDFVRAKDLQVNLKLLPLFRKEVQIKKMILHDPVINIIRNEKGVYNFSTIAKQEKEKQEAKKEREQATPKETQASSAFWVALVDISDGTVRYRDRKDGTDLQLRDIDLGAKDLDFDKPFTVNLAAALFAPKQNIKIKTTIGPLSRAADYRDLPLEGQIDADPLDLSQLEAAMPKLKAMLPNNLALGGLFKIDSLKLKGTLKDLSIKGTLVANDGSIRFGNSFQKDRGIALTVSTDSRYTGHKILVNQSQIKLHNLELASKGDITLGDRPALNVSIDAKPASLDGWEKIVPALAAYELSGKMDLHATARGEIGKGASPQIQGTASLQEASAKPPQFSKPIENLNAKINFTGQRADLKETTFNLGRSKIRLTAAIERFAPLTLSYKVSTPE